ncbi:MULTISPECIES: hypothetical protein [unclassified Bacillus cereus group]|uniref:hypothetical protein n=1 Tax=unclassified Bacillus cereus group TaxID=2750818 RepID=UPI001F59B190|nr:MULTISPECIES: hypothetical protein [unclassified Bacillus cereus group]
MSIGNIFSILSIILFMYILWEHKKEVKEMYENLTVMQLIGMILSYIVATFVAFLFIYYGGNWIVNYIPFSPLKTVVSIIIIVAVLFCCLKVLNHVLKKICGDAL